MLLFYFKKIIEDLESKLEKEMGVRNELVLQMSGMSDKMEQVRKSLIVNAAQESLDVMQLIDQMKSASTSQTSQLEESFTLQKTKLEESFALQKTQLEEALAESQAKSNKATAQIEQLAKKVKKTQSSLKK